MQKREVFQIVKLIFFVSTINVALQRSFSVNNKQYMYSPFRIVQITDSLEFLCKYCEEKSENFTEFQTSLDVTKNIRIVL